MAELRRLAVDGFDEKQLATAKAAFAGTVKIDRQTNGSIRDESPGALYGTGLDAVAKRLEIGRATTLAELRATAGRWFGAERFATGIVRGRATPRHRRGPVAAPPPAGRGHGAEEAGDTRGPPAPVDE